MTFLATISAKNTALLAALLSGAMLAGAFGFQYIGGLAPCHLCLLERWPHGIALALGVLIALRTNRWLYLLGALILAYGTVLAGYHVGVEQGWWTGPTSCTSQGITGLSTKQLMDQIMAAPLVRCDEIAWSMLGISMAGWNGILSLVLTGAWLRAFRLA